MKLWLISQTANDRYDTFDSAVVVAETAEDACRIHPAGDDNAWDYTWSTWAKTPEEVSAEYIGEARPDILQGVVLASFNAG